MVELDGKMYLIATDVFLLGLPVLKLSPEEVLALPVKVSWSGPQLRFETDSESCFRILAEIFYDFNLMQNKNFVSFPIGML